MTGNAGGWMALSVTLILLIWLLGAFSGAELWLQDVMYQHPQGAANNIFVIGIDEQTLTELGPFETWSRSGMAQMLDVLTADPENAPAVIGLDVGFYGQKNPADDAALAEAAARAGNVVAVGSATFGTVIERTEAGEASVVNRPLLLEKPFPALEAVTTWGHANINLDKDGVVRRSFFDFTYNGETVESFAAALYRRYTGQAASPQTDGDVEWRIPYTALPYAYYGLPGRGASFSRVLSGEYPAALFKDAIVLIGAYAQSMQDSFDTPVSRETRMYGVEIHANILQALLEDRALLNVHWGTVALLCGALWAACLCMLRLLPFGYSIPGVVMLGAAYILGASLLSENGWMLPLVPPVAGIFCMTLVLFTVEFAAMLRERKRLITDFSRYLPQEVARHVAERGEKTLQLGGLRRDIAVLFVDIRGFTQLSEQLGPEALVSVLNQFLVLTTACVFEHRGTVDKFIGDSTMALFNAPEELPDYTLRAVLAALDMLEAGRVLAEKLIAQGNPSIGFGIGIHSGQAVVGNVGTEHRLEYTAIGDMVNTAARLEGLAQAGEIIISEEVYRQVKSNVSCTYLGEKHLKGKTAPVPLWRVDAVKERMPVALGGVIEA